MATEKSLKEMSLEELWGLFPITIEQHNPDWAEWASEEMESIRSMLAYVRPAVSHIGSTAIPGICAKPIVDLLVETADMKDWDSVVEAMEANGYILMSRSENRMSFNKGYTLQGYAERVFHIHFHIAGDKDELRFRDYLLANPEAAESYGRLKLSLLPEFRNDRDGYTAAKTDFIKEVLRKAPSCAEQPSSDCNMEVLNRKKILELLGQKAGLHQIKEIARAASASKEAFDLVWARTASDDRRVAVNSLWALTHVDESASGWLCGVQKEMIARLLAERDASKTRIYLQLLRRQKFDVEAEESIRLFDYCLSKINSECEPYAVRCFSIYVAIRICKDYPELVLELERRLELLELQPLSPGLKSGLRQTRQKIKRLKRK